MGNDIEYKLILFRNLLLCARRSRLQVVSARIWVKLTRHLEHRQMSPNKITVGACPQLAPTAIYIYEYIVPTPPDECSEGSDRRRSACLVRTAPLQHRHLSTQFLCKYEKKKTSSESQKQSLSIGKDTYL